jgi:BirA family biotin operon repressor/biotin-[acetyl-CoA-carboxylase] ligase
MRRIHLDVTDSTNSRARELSENGEWAFASGEPGPFLVTAAEQSAGRGRRGREWHSPRGGAWMSLVWPMRRETAWYAGASVAAAVAVRRGVAQVLARQQPAESHTGVDLQIKWPNDLLIDDRKVAGILCEQFVTSHGGGHSAAAAQAISVNGALVVGVGVNVDFDVALLGPQAELRHPATTLAAATRQRVGVHAIIEAVSSQLLEVLEDFEREGLSESVIGDLRSHLAYVGTTRSWNSPHGVVSGLVLGVDESGRLLMEIDGRVQAIDVGEIVGNE